MKIRKLILLASLCGSFITCIFLLAELTLYKETNNAYDRIMRQAIKDSIKRQEQTFNEAAKIQALSEESRLYLNKNFYALPKACLVPYTALYYDSKTQQFTCKKL